MIARHLVIRGRVQGVGYRDAMVDAATALGIAGWVRNRRDGAVEAWLQGDAEAVDRLVAWCRRGPAPARVNDVAIETIDADPVHGAFVRRRTD